MKKIQIAKDMSVAIGAVPPAVVIFYHRIDFDGRGSAFLLVHWCKKLGLDYTLVPINYDETFDVDCTDKLVFMSDITLTPEQMKNIYDCSRAFIWIEHHITSIQKISKNDLTKTIRFEGIRDSRFSGIELTYLYLQQEFDILEITKNHHPQDDSELVYRDVPLSKISPKGTPSVYKNIPQMVRLIGRYDVWDENWPRWEVAVNFQFALKQWQMDPEQDYHIWMRLRKPGVSFNLANTYGPTLRKFWEQQCQWYIDEYGYEARFKEGPFVDKTVYAMNTGYKSSLNFRNRLDKYDVLFAFVLLPNGTFGVSVYSATGTNVAEIAEYYGGGGHVGAAGFKCETLPIVSMAPMKKG